jgi:hypothetical protein
MVEFNGVMFISKFVKIHPVMIGQILTNIALHHGHLDKKAGQMDGWMYVHNHLYAFFS